MQSFLDGRVVARVGDITLEETDAIVNAANSSLMGGGGVDGAIHRAGGAELLEACREVRRTLWPEGLPTGEAALTTGGRLSARYVIHTVGPIYGQHGGREAELLAACYRNSLALAKKHALSSIAFPAISTGIYGYPQEEAARISSASIKEFLASDETLREVHLVFFSPRAAELFLQYQEL